LARHNPKKKKESDKPETPDQPEISDTSDTPPTEPIQSDQEKSYTKRKLDKLFWLRIGLAVLAGIAATFLFDTIEGEERRWASIIFMIIIFIVSIVIAKGMNLQLPKSDRKKLVTTGIGSYIFIYLFMWILTYTIVNLPKDSVFSIPFS
jgi:multidrug transporter EmrE-like cation transporter